jgi:oligogalacturonide lyase
MTRRTFLAAVAATASGADSNAIYPSEWSRYSDPATEFNILRLTDPARASYLTHPGNRAISRRGGFLLFTTDRGNGLALWRMDLKSGQSHELARDEGIVSASPALTSDEKFCFYVAKGGVFAANLANAKSRRVYSIPDGFSAGDGFAVSEDGLNAFLVERQASSGHCRLMAIPLRGGLATVAAESAEPISDPQPRPKRAGLMYRRGEQIWLVNFDGAQNRRLRSAAGGTGQALWSPDGRQILYLNFPEDRTQLHQVRELTPDANEDGMVASTSQFIGFGVNGDGSVLAGASGSKASPYVLLLVRSVRRELTLCEHHCSNTQLVCPVFAPDSRRVYFQSDRHGKLAIYSLNVEKLVAETEVE